MTYFAISMLLCLGQVATGANDPAQAQLQPVPDDPVEFALRVKRTRELMKQMGADKFAERQAAYFELREIGCRSVELLEAAGRSDDPEIVARAQKLIEEFTAYTHIVRDAVGNPLPAAEVRILDASGEQLKQLHANECGHVSIPDFDNNQFASGAGQAIIRHADYGSAKVLFSHRHEASPGALSVPLVNRQSPAYQRAVRGNVVRPDGTPVAGAEVRCRELRTPGMGLISSGQMQTVFADEEGRFALYADQRLSLNRATASKLIPPNTRYHISVFASHDKLFPWGGSPSNNKPITVVLREPEQQYKVRFEDQYGASIKDDPDEGENIRVRYHAPGSDDFVSLRGALVMKGRLPHGRYLAFWRHVPLLPVVIDETTGEDVVFRMPQPKTVAGTVVDAETERPIEGAFVVTLHSTSDHWLTGLADADWDLLSRQQPNKIDEEALNLLRPIYGQQTQMTRSAADGSFSLTESVPNAMHSIVAFTRNHVPMIESRYCLDQHEKDRKGPPVFTLYPAGFVTVTPAKQKTPKNYMSVFSDWIIHDAHTPKLLARIRETTRTSNEQHADRMKSLTAGKQNRIMVPANTRMQLTLRTSYNEELSDATVDREFQLAPGEQIDLGEVRFAYTIPLTVRVVDEAGRPVEGVPVRKSVDGRNLSIGVNTNVRGESTLMVDANARGFVKATGIPYTNELSRASNLTEAFEVGETAKEVITIRLTDEQVGLIVGADAGGNNTP